MVNMEDVVSAGEVIRLDPKMAGIEEITHDEYVKGVSKFTTSVCMRDTLNIIKNALKDAEGNLENSIKAIESEDVLGVWDPLEQIVNYLPMQMKSSWRPLTAVEMNRRMMRDLREWMKRSKKEDITKARFYHKGGIYFWDPSGKEDPIMLLNKYLGALDQTAQEQMPQTPQATQTPKNDVAFM